jgi:hypothetical protein
MYLLLHYHKHPFIVRDAVATLVTSTVYTVATLVTSTVYSSYNLKHRTTLKFRKHTLIYNYRVELRYVMKWIYCVVINECRYNRGVKYYG